MMKRAVRIVIVWSGGDEFLEFDPAGLRAGTSLNTVEFWPEEALEVKYNVKCTSNELNADGTRTIQLLYDPNLNQGLGQRVKDIPWGITKLNIGRSKVKATYAATKSDWGSGDARYCELLSAAVFAQRKRRIVQVVQRTGQQRLRSRLLEFAMPRCAITGEEVKAVLDAAHIVDDSLDGVAETTNGLLLRADLHRLFDARPKGGRRKAGTDYLTIDGSGRVCFSPSLQKHIVYAEYHDKLLADGAALRRTRRSLQEAEKLLRDQ